MNAEWLEQELRSYFQTEMRQAEPGEAWWSGAIHRAVEEKHRKSWPGIVLRTRLAWALVPLALLFIAGVAYASSSVIRERFMSLFPQVEQSGLAQQMDLSETVDNVTVRVERAYADSNAVLIGYTVSGPPNTATGPGARYFSNVGGLAVAGGPVLPSIGASGTVPGSKDVLGNWNPSDRLAVVALFDASALQGTPSELSVKLPVKVFDRVPIPEVGQPSQQTFTFDFRVKFHPAKVVNVGQKIIAAGVPITVEHVVISHWATRAVLKFDSPYDNRDYKPALIDTMTPAGAAPTEGDGTTFYGDFTPCTGEWTMTINELVFFQGLPPGVNSTVPKNENGQVRLKGPWTIHFNVP